MPPQQQPQQPASSLKTRLAARRAATAAARAAQGQQQQHAGPCHLLEALPDELLAAVLQPLARAGDTLSVLSAGSCCTRLHVAAAEALSRLSTPFSRQHKESLLCYLHQHGQRVVSLELSGLRWPFLQALPVTCSTRMRSLRLVGMMHARLGDSRRHPGVLQAAGSSSLTCLSLSGGVRILDTPESIAAGIARLTALRHLELAAAAGSSSSAGSSSTALPGSMLAALEALTHLRLGYFLRSTGTNPGPPHYLQDATLEHLGSLTGLRSLCLLKRSSQDSPPLGAPLSSALQRLPHLTELALAGCQFSASLAAALSTLAALRLLRLCAASPSEGRLFNPVFLKGPATGLNQLVLGNVRLGAGLLARLQHCTQLTHLHLGDHAGHDDDDDDDDGSAPAAAAYAALTASSSLVVLRVGAAAGKVPAGALQAMFGGGKSLPHLAELALQLSRGVNGVAAAPVLTADTAELARCCPALRKLGIFGPLPNAALAPLTALARLEHLLLYSGLFSPGLSPRVDRRRLQLTSQAAEGAAPDVAEQLRQRLAHAAAPPAPAAPAEAEDAAAAAAAAGN